MAIVPIGGEGIGSKLCMNMKNFYKQFNILIIVVLLLAGCSQAGVLDVYSDQMDNSVTPSALPTSTATATAFPTPLPPTASPERTPTMLPDTKIIRNCITIASDMAEEGYAGTIILKERVESGFRYFLVDLATMKKTTIGLNIDLIVSPDGKHYLYRDFEEDNIKLFSADNQLLASYDWREDWYWLARWQNNQNLLIFKHNEIRVTPSLASPMGYDYPRPLILFDPFTDQEHLLAPDYPEIDRVNNRLQWEDSGTTIYNYQLTQVVYPGTAVSELGVILWDISTGTVVVEIDDPYLHGYPKWAQDGSKFIIPWLEAELFTVTNLGEISQITKLNHGDYRYHPERYTWSPDGRYVAMWLNDTKTSSGSFVILNMQSKEIIDYCISIDQYLGGFVDTVTPIWAQNSKALLIEANLDEDSDEKTALLLDLENNFAVRLAEDAVPIGWLDTQD